MFSVIIPIYNKVNYIEKSVQSVLNQTFNDFEIIIVNDGSTDNSLEIVQQYNNSTTQQFNIINQPNFGVSIARNNGVKAANYEYIAFLDADDWWDMNYLSEMQTIINDYPEAGIWAAKYFKVKNGKNIEANIGLEKEFKRGYINYFNVYSKTMWMPITSSSFVIKKEIFNDFNGFKSNLKIGEDFDLWVRIALKYKIAYLNIPLVYYNQDVVNKDRGVILNKIYLPETHFIFNLDFLNEKEQTNEDLHYLLDLLRIYTLLRYRLQNAFPIQLKKEVDKIKFKNQPISNRLKYSLPIPLVKAWYKFRRIAGQIYKKLTK